MLRPNSDTQPDMNVAGSGGHGVRGGGAGHTRKAQINQQTQNDPATPRQTTRAANAGGTTPSAGDTPSPPATRDDKSSFHSILNHYYSSDSSGDSDSDSGNSGDAKSQQDSSQDSNNTAVAPVDAGTARKDIAPLTLTFAFPLNVTIPTAQAQTQAPSATTAEAPAATSQTAQSALQALESDLEETLTAAQASNPTIEESNGPNVQRGDLAFAAKLNLNTTDNGKAEAQANNSQSGNSAGNSQDGNTDAKSRNIAAAAQQTQLAAKPPASSQPSETDSPVEKTRAIAFADAAPKPSPATMLAQEPAAATNTMTANAKPVEATPQTNAGEVARIEQAMDIPAPAASSHDITVRIADAGEHGADIRFVEHAGEVRVSVKTADPEMAQALRGGLNDFANRMEQSGIRTEVWRPGADANSSQNPQDQFDQKGRQQNRERDSQHGSQEGSQQENPNSSKPRWVEELETSLARSN
jgi:hypothetical protein